MTRRMLPPSEWPRLDATDSGIPWQSFDPANHAIFVIEDDGVIVGSIALMWAFHAECAWIADEYRKIGTVGKRLQEIVQQEAAASGSKSVWASALSVEMRDLLLKHCSATVIPGEHFILPIQEPACRPLSH